MGGSGEPIPPPSSVTDALNYFNQHFTVLPANAHALFTPEGLYPLTGVKSLTLDASVAQGVQILDSAIKKHARRQPLGQRCRFWRSQSAIVSSLEMENLANPMLNPSPPTANQLGFILVGDQMNPNGGILARFPGFPAGQPLQIPSLGFTFYGATPSNTIYPTNIYTLEYDGFADFPQYPINLISDLNAFAGIYYVHNTYPENPSALPPGYDIQQLPTSPGYTGVTNYYMITTQNGLPLLDPVRAIPVIGNPIADLLQPDLTTIVNLGYGNPNFGWSQGPADVHTYFGLFPHVSQALIAQDLVTGAQQGATRLRQRHPRRSHGRVAVQPVPLADVDGGNGRSGSVRADVGAVLAQRHYRDHPGGDHQCRQRDLGYCREPLRSSASDGRHRECRRYRDPGL